jgi:hypothetical protein
VASGPRQSTRSSAQRNGTRWIPEASSDTYSSVPRTTPSKIDELLPWNVAIGMPGIHMVASRQLCRFNGLILLPMRAGRVMAIGAHRSRECVSSDAGASAVPDWLYPGNSLRRCLIGSPSMHGTRSSTLRLLPRNPETHGRALRWQSTLVGKPQVEASTPLAVIVQRMSGKDEPVERLGASD